MLLRDNRQAVLQSNGDLLITQLSESECPECPENTFIQEQTDKNIFEPRSLSRAALSLASSQLWSFSKLYL